MPFRFAILLVTLCCSAGFSENWPNWRGPNHDGSTSETGLPTKWSRTENVKWVADLPGASAATPAIWGDHVFVSSDDKENSQLVALCFDRETGKELWKNQFSSKVRKDSRSTFSSPSPATNGKVVVFFYGEGSMLAYDFSGKEIWTRNIQNDFGEFAFLWTFSTSPVVQGDNLFLQVLQRDTAVDGRGFTDKKNESYILALNANTGDLIWRSERPSQAKAESREAFTTPVIHNFDGKEQLIVAGGDALTGHDLATGDELWRWGTWNPDRIGHWRLVVSPVVGKGNVLVCAPKKDPIYAIKLGGSGTLGDDDISWVSREEKNISSDVPTPAFYDGDFFVLSDVRKSLARIEPDTGEVKWSVTTPGNNKFEASPLVADGKIYTINFAGDVATYSAANGKLLSNISMDEAADDAVRSSIVAAQGNLFIRTNKKLYCIGS